MRRTDKHDALDDIAAWILGELKEQWPGRLALNSHEIGQVLDEVYGPSYDKAGDPQPRKDPTELARRAVASGAIHDGHHGRIAPGKGASIIVPLPALAASLASMMIDPTERAGDWVMELLRSPERSPEPTPEPTPVVLTQSRGPLTRRMDGRYS